MEEETSSMIRRYVGPVAMLLGVLVVWTWLVGPWVEEKRQDLAFLRYVRIQSMQQAQKAQPATQPAAPTAQVEK